MLDLIDHTITPVVSVKEIALVNPELASKITNLGGDVITVKGPLELVSLLNEESTHTYFFACNAKTLDVVVKWNNIHEFADIVTVTDSTMSVSPEWMEATRAISNIDLPDALSIAETIKATGQPAVDDPDESGAGEE